MKSQIFLVAFFYFTQAKRTLNHTEGVFLLEDSAFYSQLYSACLGPDITSAHSRFNYIKVYDFGEEKKTLT